MTKLKAETKNKCALLKHLAFSKQENDISKLFATKKVNCDKNLKINKIQRLRSPWFKPLPRLSVVEVSSLLTSSSCCLYQHHATEVRSIESEMHSRNKQTFSGIVYLSLSHARPHTIKKTSEAILKCLPGRQGSSCTPLLEIYSKYQYVAS